MRLPWRKDDSQPGKTVYHNPATCAHSESESSSDNGDGSVTFTFTCGKCGNSRTMTVGREGSSADWLS